MDLHDEDVVKEGAQNVSVENINEQVNSTRMDDRLFTKYFMDIKDLKV